MKNSAWLPFLLPLVVFLAAGIFIPALGTVLLTIAVSTGAMFQAPVPKSTAVIIVALILSLVIAGGAAIVASRPETPVLPRDHSSPTGH